MENNWIDALKSLERIVEKLTNVAGMVEANIVSYFSISEIVRHRRRIGELRELQNSLPVLLQKKAIVVTKLEWASLFLADGLESPHGEMRKDPIENGFVQIRIAEAAEFALGALGETKNLLSSSKVGAAAFKEFPREANQLLQLLRIPSEGYEMLGDAMNYPRNLRRNLSSFAAIFRQLYDLLSSIQHRLNNHVMDLLEQSPIQPKLNEKN